MRTMTTTTECITSATQPHDVTCWRCARGKGTPQRTPGPWRVAYSNERDNFMVVGPDGDSRIGQCMERGDARLIAAAPELLAALKAIVRITDGSQPKDYPGAVMIARVAIATATGQEG